MKKTNKQELEDDLRPEYDLKSLLISGVRGKYAHSFRKGTNIVLLDPDVASVFPNDEAVNEVLRLVIQLRKLPKSRQSRETEGGRCCIHYIVIEFNALFETEETEGAE